MNISADRTNKFHNNLLAVLSVRATVFANAIQNDLHFLHTLDVVVDSDGIIWQIAHTTATVTHKMRMRMQASIVPFATVAHGDFAQLSQCAQLLKVAVNSPQADVGNLVAHLLIDVGGIRMSFCCRNGVVDGFALF